MNTFGKQTLKYRRLMKYSLRQWRALIVILLLTIASSAVTLLQPWPLKLLVDYALGKSTDSQSLGSFLNALPVAGTTVLILFAGIASIALFMMTSLLEAGFMWGWSSCGQRAVHELAADLFNQLQRLSLLFHSKRTVGDSMSRLTGDAYCVYTSMQVLLIGPGQHLLTLTTVGMVAWHLDPWLTALTFAIAPLQAGGAFFYGNRLKWKTEQNRKAHSDLVSFVHQTLTAIPMVQAFGAEVRNGQRFRNLADDSVKRSQVGTLLASSYGFMNGLITTLGSAIVLYAGAQRVAAGVLSVGSLLVFLAYMRALQGSLQGLLTTYSGLKILDVTTDRVVEILEADDPVQNAASAKPLPALTTGQRGHVRIENVTFGYELGRPVLSEVNLEALPGETVALVGPTGAGKSTLVSLIPRFYDPWHGRIVVDGMDAREIQISSLRASVALVLQDPFLLPITVAENIAYGRPDASRNDIIAAAVVANADEFIRRLPDGYDTVMAERAATLSGGEKQSIAIARAILKDAPILILDEPTSSLDVKTEASLLEALQRLMVGRTTFIIAHRLSTIRHADKIAVIENGKLIEAGTHEELLAVNGHYRHVHTLQFGEPIREVAG